ncbi:probable glycosyltransferase At5g03795 [Abrus precatorius]|uniref:Probable glycosyltransferase At5g03795 n=1 Tax=Abrus precatorius TaxID=3816 RepID=A0A8B8LWL9_ABRPR|nr:probable glycosyltransferase At5g03795 [Abrus precatorius]
MRASKKCFSWSTCWSYHHIVALFFIITSLVVVSCGLRASKFSSFVVSWSWRGEPTSPLDIESKSVSTLYDDVEAPYTSAFPSNHDESRENNEGDEKLDTKFKHKGKEKGNLRAHKYNKLKNIEGRLAKARCSIREASKVRNFTSTLQDPDYVPQGPIYRNANAFHRSYLEMEKVFKIFVYDEGEPPMFHNGLTKSIYSTEGRFINEMEKGRYYRTNDPDEAFVYYLPFSVVMMVEYLYVHGSNINPIGLTVEDYIQIISNKHPFWNRSLGHDHFMLSCHDWGPIASTYVDHLFNNAIRVLCNANTSEGFKPAKDVSFPEINLITGEITGLIGGYPPSQRTILAFFAGRLHGHIRHLLLKAWKDKDQDVQVYEELPQGVSYYTKLRSSKFCLCPSGYEVASPRIVEAIFAECVPVLISDSYVPPFSDVLNWKSFSIQVDVKEIPNIKKILMGISQRQYLRMLKRVKQVQRHFVPNEPPKRFDVFHMTIHSIWLRRLNVHIQDH